MTPDQLAMVEQMMRGCGMPGAVGPVAAPTSPVFRQAGSDKVGQCWCSKYEDFRGQDKIAEVCTVNPKDLGLTASDFEAAKRLADFVKTLAPQAADEV